MAGYVIVGTCLSFAGVPLLDYGARLYSARTGQWMSPDPLGEEYRSVSPYAYCAGNPVDFVDPDGMDIWEINGTGHVVSRTEDSQRNIVGNSHDSQSTVLVGYHFYTGYTIRESNHYHPSGNEKPSKADINLRQKIQTQQPNSKFYVYVYFGRYVNFSKNETESSERY